MHACLKTEVTGGAQPRLVSILRDNSWWLRAVHAPKICGIIGMECKVPSYFRDIYVWIPDERWGRVSMPTCPHCLSNQVVGPHGWRDNHFGRRITGLDTHYFVISRRYICHGCEGAAAALKMAKEKAAAAKAAAAAAAAAAHAMADGSENEVSRTFLLQSLYADVHS